MSAEATSTPAVNAPDVDVVIGGEQREIEGTFDSPEYVMDAETLGGSGVSPDNGVVSDHGAGRVVGGSDDRMTFSARIEVDLGTELLYLVGPDENRVDAKRLI